MLAKPIERYWVVGWAWDGTELDNLVVEILPYTDRLGVTSNGVGGDSSAATKRLALGFSSTVWRKDRVAKSNDYVRLSGVVATGRVKSNATEQLSKA